MSKRIVIAPDSFKGSLSASEVASAISAGWKQVRPNDTLLLAPQADGGEGTLDAIQAAFPTATRHVVGLVTGPDLRPQPGEWLELPNRVAVVELAQCSGLPLMKELDALHATSRGLGEVIAAALDFGIYSLIIGVGGSASTDGGAGALSALGLELLDAEGNHVSDGGVNLINVAQIKQDRLRSAPRGGVIILTDVRSPLLGSEGSAAVFSPQKGAEEKDVALLDSALAHFAELLGGDPQLPGSGAAGGTAYGFATTWKAKIESGADYISKISQLSDELGKADLLITGEGKFDPQSLSGKVVGQLIAQAKTLGIPTAVIAGQSTFDSGGWQCSLVELAGSVESALRDPRHWLAMASAQLAHDF